MAKTFKSTVGIRVLGGMRALQELCDAARTATLYGEIWHKEEEKTANVIFGFGDAEAEKAFKKLVAELGFETEIPN